MALVLANRVQETGTANTTVSFTLTGAVGGFQSFAAVGNTNTTFYAATDASGNWEVGLGTYSTTGPTLTRTTVYASNNSGSAVTFSGTCNVFLTYPSGRSVNLDASGNVSALGTIASGTWQGTTVGVAYGGTGVTVSSGASSVMLRDANQNTTFNNYIAGFTATTASAGTTVLTVASTRNQILTGSTTHTFQMPNATTLQLGQSFLFVNNSSGVLTITNNASATIESIPSGGVAQLGATNIGTSAGTFGIYSFLPGTYDFNNTTATFNNAAISSAVWNGTTIASAYGGTGLTTFTAANNALYSTSSSALAAGTLPVAAGGTGQTSYTDGQLLIGNTTGNTLAKTTLTAGTGVSVTNGAGSITVANTGVTSITGTASQVTASASTGGVTLSLPATINVNTSGNAANVTGTVAVGNGGTGLTSTPANGALDIGNGTGFTRTTLAAGTAIGVANGVGSITISNNGVTSLTTSSGLSANTSATGAVSVTNTGVTSNVAGTGISVSGATGAVTITNSGVTSLTTSSGLSTNTSATGAVSVTNTGVTSIVAGTNISISGATGAVTITNGITNNNQLTNGSGFITAVPNVSTQVSSLGVGTAASGTAGEIRATNNITAYYSDIRLKTKVGDITDPLGKVRQIETMLYHANETAVGLGYDASIIEVGLSAQSVQAVQPEAVAPAPIDAKYLTVRYERLVPLLLESVKALEDRIIELEAKLKG